MSKPRIALVTGANQGIGLAIVRQLALAYPTSPISSNNTTPFLIYLAARDQTRGEEAVSSLKNDTALHSAKALTSHSGNTTITYANLDITSSSTTAALASRLRSAHPEGIDIVINNAGIALDGFSPAVVRDTLAVNYYGTLSACRTFLPLLKPGGRLVNVASMAGSLAKYSPELREAFHAAQTEAQLSRLMADFQSAVERGTHIEMGWPGSAYMVSKAGVIGLTRVLAREQTATADDGQGILINAVCPGYVNTRMTKGRGPRSVDEGAVTPVMLALGDLKESDNGLFWQDGKVVEWDVSLVQTMLASRRKMKRS